MTASPTTGVDTRDMLVVHDSIRRQFGQAPALVRGVAAGDTDRAAVVADHVDLLGALLHHHHRARTGCSGRCCSRGYRPTSPRRWRGWRASTTASPRRRRR